MYSADCRVTDSWTRTKIIYDWNILFFANTLHVQQLSNKPGTATEIVEKLQMLARLVRDFNSSQRV